MDFDWEEEKPRRRVQEKPKEEEVVRYKTLTLGPLAGRKYVVLSDGRLGPRIYDDIARESEEKP